MFISLSWYLLMFSLNYQERFSDGFFPVLLWKEGRSVLCGLLLVSRVIVQPFHGIFNFTFAFQIPGKSWWNFTVIPQSNPAYFRLLTGTGGYCVWEDWRTVENIYTFLKSWGWGHISVCRVLPMEHEDLILVLSIRVKSQVWQYLFVMPTLRKQRRASWGSLASQPSLISKPIQWEILS